MATLDVGTLSELIDRARGRDEAAFTVLVGPRLEGLLRIATAILGHEADARDALQIALTSAWANLPGLRDADRFEAWLTRIVVNECRHALRRRARTRVRELPMEHVLAAQARGSLHTAGPEASLAERLAFERAFERLPGEARALLVLHHLERLPIDVIAQILAIPAGTVKSRLHAARRALERELEKESR